MTLPKRCGERQDRRLSLPCHRLCPGSDAHTSPYSHLPAGPDLSRGLVMSTPSLSRFRPSVEKRKLRAEWGSARNSIWCLSVSALSQSPAAGDAACAPPGNASPPPPARPKQGPWRAGNPELLGWGCQGGGEAATQTRWSGVWAWRRAVWREQPSQDVGRGIVTTL